MKWFVALLTFCACNPPPVVATADPPQSVMTSRIEGHVIVEGPARGNVVLLLFDAQRLPPPYGFGRPLTFATVKGSDVFGDAAGNGPFSAPFAFSLVKPGHYFVGGILDTNADFNPFFSVTAGANGGDVVGGSVDPVTLAPQVITVADAALDVAVSFSQAGVMPVDRPAFQVLPPGPSVVVNAPMTVVQLAPQPVDDRVVSEKQPVFLAQLAADGMTLEWPKVVVRKLADPMKSLLADDNDLDGDGVPDDPSKPVIVLKAALVPGAMVPSMAAPTPVTSVNLVLYPVALDATDPASPKLAPAGSESGAYSITLIAPTGQTWRVPNELAPPIASVAMLPSITTQQVVVQVP